MNEQTALEELTFIKNIIQDSRRKVIENGLGFIIWGILVLLGLLSTYFMLVNKIYLSIPWNWIILMGAGWLYTFLKVRKYKKKKVPSSFAVKIIGALWFSSGISMTLFGFVAPASGAVNGVFISPMISVVLGIAYFVSGFLYDSKWISLLAYGWWAGAIVMFFYPGMQVFLIMSTMLILFQIVPGIVLYSKFRKEPAVSA